MNRVLFMASIALTLAAVIWGVSIVGGPGYARMEKNDQDRIRDLNTLGSYHRCVAIRKYLKPDGISPNYCGQADGPPPSARDPLTDAPYRYTEEPGESFQVCATFEIGEEGLVRSRRLSSNVVFDGKEGCITYRRHGDVWSIVSL